MNHNHPHPAKGEASALWRTLLALALACFLLLSLTPLPAAATPDAVPAATVLNPNSAQIADDQAEIDYQPTYLDLATGIAGAEHNTYGWPFALESMGHAIQSYQYYGGSPYFHHGLDIMAPNGTDVLNRSGGQVVNVENYTPGNDLYWEVAILDPEGYLWQYHHIDQYTIPQLIWDKWNEYLVNPVTGGFIPPDTYIGDIVYWPVGYPGAPTNFHHIHLNILGAGGIYLNGFEFHTPLNDTQNPEILAVGLLKNNQVYPGNQVTGDYGLYVHARDLVLSNLYWLPPFEILFSLDGGPATTVWRFDTLPGGADRYAYVSDFYVVPPTCGDYGCNEFYIDLGFTTAGQRAFPSTSGQHTIAVTVKDYAGNAVTNSFTWTVMPAMSMHVGDLDRSTAWNPNGSWKATVTITVHNFAENPVNGVTVSGRWRAGSLGLEGGIETVTCTTNSSGKCSIVKQKVLNSIPFVQFKVAGVTGGGYTYFSQGNHDPDGDSNGMLITINKP